MHIFILNECSAASASRCADRARSSAAAAMRSCGDGAPGRPEPAAVSTVGLGIILPRDGVSRSRCDGETETHDCDGAVTSETPIDGAPLALSSMPGTMTTRRPRAPGVTLAWANATPLTGGLVAGGPR